MMFDFKRKKNTCKNFNFIIGKARNYFTTTNKKKHNNKIIIRKI